jgi:TRAP-type C4-dicarboxylate transport system permease small subunit
MKRFFNKIEETSTFLGIGSLFLMVWLTTVDTMGRYFFNSPLPGSYAITEKYLMIFAIYFALSFSYREGTHIRLTFVTGRLRSQKIKLACNYIAQIVTILFNILLVTASIKLLIEGYKDFWDATRFKLPLWPSYLIAALGLFMACLWMIADLWQVKKGKSCLFKEEESAKTEEAAVI